jgi:hypothetical protein
MMVTAVTEILQEDTQTFCGLLLSGLLYFSEALTPAAA